MISQTIISCCTDGQTLTQYVISQFLSQKDNNFKKMFSNLFIPHYILARDKTNLQDRSITVRSFEELKIKFPEIIKKSKSNPNELYCVHLDYGHGFGIVVQNGKFLLIDSMGIGGGFNNNYDKLIYFMNNEMKYLEHFKDMYLGIMVYDNLKDKKKL